MWGNSANKRKLEEERNSTYVKIIQVLVNTFHGTHQNQENHGHLRKKEEKKKKTTKTKKAKTTKRKTKNKFKNGELHPLVLKLCHIP